MADKKVSEDSENMDELSTDELKELVGGSTPKKSKWNNQPSSKLGDYLSELKTIARLNASDAGMSGVQRPLK